MAKNQSQNEHNINLAELYLRRHLNQFSLDTLKAKLFEIGYKKEEIDEAVVRLDIQPTALPVAKDPLDIGELLTKTWNFFKDNFMV